MDDLKDPGVAAYLDDILLHTQSVKEHLKLLEKVFKAHFQVGFMINPKKTVLFAKAMDYLGYRVTGNGLTLTDKFIRDIREWAQPSGPKELATALGFFGYYREFLPQFSRYEGKTEVGGLRLGFKVGQPISGAKGSVLPGRWPLPRIPHGPR